MKYKGQYWWHGFMSACALFLITMTMAMKGDASVVCGLGALAATAFVIAIPYGAD